MRDITFFQMYFGSPHFLIAYSILTIFIFISFYKKMHIVKLSYFAVLSVFTVGFFFDGIYDLFNMWIYSIVFFIPFMLYCWFIWKNGNLRKLWYIAIPTLFEIITMLQFIDCSDITRYLFVLSFISVTMFIKDNRVYHWCKKLEIKNNDTKN